MALVDSVWERLNHLNHSGGKRRVARELPVLRAITTLRALTLAAIIALVASGAVYEMRTSLLEATYFTRIDRDMSFRVEPGPSGSVVFPKNSPYDERFGYAGLPQFASG